MQEQKKCPVCQHPIKFADSVFCGNCGHRLVEEQPEVETEHATQNKCPRCQAQIKNKEARFCGVCGYNLQNTEPMIQPAPVSTIPPESSVQSTRQPFPQFVMDQQSSRGQPDIIRPVQNNFSAELLKIIGIFSVTLLIAHFFRYLLVYNDFPSFYEMWVAYIFYLLFTLTAIYSIMYYYNKSGVAMNYDVDKYDFAYSGILSTFFISTISMRVLIDTEKSTLPTTIRRAVYDKKKGYMIQSLDKNSYIGKFVRPLAFRMRVYIILGFGYSVFFLQGILDPALSKSIGLIIGFIAVFSLLETESNGRNKQLIKKGQRNFLNVIITIAGVILLALSFGTDSLASLGQLFG